VNQPPRAAIHQRQSGRDQGMLRSSKADLLGKRRPKDHSSLTVVGEPLPRCAVNQRVEVRHPPQDLSSNRDCQRLVGRLQITGALRGRIERPPAPQDGIEHLQRSPARR